MSVGKKVNNEQTNFRKKIKNLRKFSEQEIFRPKMFYSWNIYEYSEKMKILKTKIRKFHSWRRPYMECQLYETRTLLFFLVIWTKGKKVSIITERCTVILETNFLDKQVSRLRVRKYRVIRYLLGCETAKEKAILPPSVLRRYEKWFRGPEQNPNQKNKRRHRWKLSPPRRP